MKNMPMLLKKGGLREIFDAGIVYLEKVITDAQRLEDKATEKIALQELVNLETFKNQNSLELKKLGVLEDMEKVSVVFECEDPPDGIFFLFKEFCFLKVEEDVIPKVSKILKTKKYISIKDKEVTVKEVE